MNINLMKALLADKSIVVTDIQMTSFYKFRLADFESVEVDETNECVKITDSEANKIYYLDVTDIDLFISVPANSYNWNPNYFFSGSPTIEEINKGNIGDEGSTTLPEKRIVAPYYTPVITKISDSQVKISWTNNGGLENPEDVIITAPKGDNGKTPTIGENGNWFIDGVDTGKSSVGTITP